MLTCFIFENDSYIQELLNVIIQIEQLTVVGTTPQIATSFNSVINKNPDIVFADARLVQQSPEIFRQISRGRFVVYTSEVTDYAYTAFQFNAIDYLIKPYTILSVSRSILKIQASTISNLGRSNLEMNNQKNFFYVKSSTQSSKKEKVSMQELINVKALENYVELNFENDKRNIVYVTMSEMQDFLPSNSFLRISKSHIINLAKINKIDGNSVFLTNGQSYPVGPSYKEQFFARIHSMTLNTKRKHKRA